MSRTIIKIKTAKSQRNIRLLSNIGLDNRLHLGVGLMKDFYHNSEEVIHLIAVANIDGIPIGAAIKLKHDESRCCNFGVYIKRKHRKKELGTALIKSIIKNGGGVGLKVCRCSGTVATLFFDSSIGANRGV